jgi:hypothetical protein
MLDKLGKHHVTVLAIDQSEHIAPVNADAQGV